jgi:hypothetical protein
MSQDFVLSDSHTCGVRCKGSAPVSHTKFKWRVTVQTRVAPSPHAGALHRHVPLMYSLLVLYMPSIPSHSRHGQWLKGYRTPSA